MRNVCIVCGRHNNYCECEDGKKQLNKIKDYHKSYLENKEKYKDASREERQRAYLKNWFAHNKDKRSEYSKRYYSKNRERLLKLKNDVRRKERVKKETQQTLII